MNKITFAFIFCVVFAFGLSAQMTPRPSDLPRVVEAGPMLIPASATDVSAVTTWVTLITLTNNSAGDVICSIKDKQATPLYLVAAAAVISAGSHWILSYPEGRRMSSGITWSCSSGTAVVGYVTGRQQ